MSLAKQLVVQIMHRQLSRLDLLYQRHAGEHCYIFGDGISLKWMDLHQFTNRPSILGSMSIYHKEINALNIPYCAITEPYFFYPMFPYRSSGKLQLLRHFLHCEYKKSIIENPQTLFLANISNYPVLRMPNVLFVSRWYAPPFESKNPFRRRADSHVGTLKFQLSLAIYLGFKKAYLLGHDYTHFPSRARHYYEKGVGVPNENRGFSREYLEYAKPHIDLVTVTIEGESETMDSITYKELTGKDPNFRENIELVDMVKLQSLATWHDYSIF